MKKLTLIILFLTAFSFNSKVFAGFPDDLSDVKFVHQNISSWPVTSNLEVIVSGSSLTLEYDKKNVWPNRSNSLCQGCNANPWVIAKFGDQWWAGTYEWFRTGQTTKDWTKVLEGGHIKGGPFGYSRSTWQPKNGEIYGFMVSGFARFPSSTVPFNAQERTNIQLYKWGVGPITNPEPPKPPVEETKPVIIPQVDLLLN